MLVAIPLVASCGGAEQGGGGGQPGGTTGGGSPVITDARVIVATPDKGTFDGNRACLRGQEVREIVSERAFYVGENDAERLLVINTGEATEVSEGQNVVVVGQLTTPQPASEQSLSLSPEEATAVESQAVFLTAARVTVQEG